MAAAAIGPTSAFGYERLTQIDNGYGGTIAVTYQAAPGEESNQHYERAWNYFVSSKTTTGTNGGSRVEYAVSGDDDDRCYDNDRNGYCVDYSGWGGGNLVGYRYVTETLRRPPAAS